MVNKITQFLAIAVVCIGASISLPAQAADKINTHIMGTPYYPPYPDVNYHSGQQHILIKRGEYLVKAGDCIACHTDTVNKGQQFAGGLAFKTPFGTFYSPNITGDKETGIGNWTDDEFVRAMQEGIRPDGQYYYPVFPYPNFTKLSREDLLAIKAYLLSVPVVHQPAHKNDVMWPFSWRFLQLGWRILFFHPGEYQYDPEHTQLWNRGSYLVQGLGHCGMCHTPMNLLGAPKQAYNLTGNFIQGFYAPDITSYGLKGVSVEEVQDVFIQDKMLKGAGVVQGPMAEVNHDSLKYLSDDDLQAIVLYLQTVKSKEPKTGSGKVTAGSGKKIYESTCSVCHAQGLLGSPKLGDKAAWQPRIQQGMDILFAHSIQGYKRMPPKGTCIDCTNAEIQAAVKYMVQESKTTGDYSLW